MRTISLSSEENDRALAKPWVIVDPATLDRPAAKHQKSGNFKVFETDCVRLCSKVRVCPTGSSSKH